MDVGVGGKACATLGRQILVMRAGFNEEMIETFRGFCCDCIALGTYMIKTDQFHFHKVSQISRQNGFTSDRIAMPFSFSFDKRRSIGFEDSRPRHSYAQEF